MGPSSPPIDYEFADFGSSYFCSQHGDKYGTQRGLKPNGKQRNCKKCKSESSKNTTLSPKSTSSSLNLFRTSKSLAYKDPYHYSKFAKDNEDEWTSYWDQEEDFDTPAEFGKLPRIKADESRTSFILKPKDLSELVTDNRPKRLTTFAATTKSCAEKTVEKTTEIVIQQNLEEDPEPSVSPDRAFEDESHSDVSSSSPDQRKSDESDEDDLQQELKLKIEAVEPLVLEYRRLRNNRKRFRKKSPVIDEVIIEEDEDEVAADNLEVVSSPVEVKSILKKESEPIECKNNEGSEAVNDENMLKVSMILKRKKGVTFSDVFAVQNAPKEETNNRRIMRQSNESLDELSGYNKVEVSKDLTDEILHEIYGTTKPAPVPLAAIFQQATPLQDEEPPMSMADEILDELYGECKANKKSDNVYEKIKDNDQQHKKDFRSSARTSSSEPPSKPETNASSNEKLLKGKS